MPRKQNSFAVALAAATKRMVKANDELQAARVKMQALSEEIPNLQSTIAALQRQLGGSPKSVTVFNNVPLPTRADAEMDTLPAPLHSDSELSEDDLLPDPDGIPVAGE